MCIIFFCKYYRNIGLRINISTSGTAHTCASILTVNPYYEYTYTKFQISLSELIKYIKIKTEPVKEPERERQSKSTKTESTLTKSR